MSKFTIDQALKHAAQLKKKISDARKRAEASVSYKEGTQPPFSFLEMVSKEAIFSAELAEIQGKLAIANATNTVEYKDKTISMSHAIRILQELKGRIAWINGLVVLTNNTENSIEAQWDDSKGDYIRRNVVTVCDLPEARKAELVDSFQDEFNLLNGILDAANKTVKLQ